MNYTDEKLMLAPGKAQFEVTEAIETVSSKGNPMVKMTLWVIDMLGGEKEVDVYLASNAGWKIKEFLISTGAMNASAKGELKAESIKGKHGYCTIVHKEEEFKNRNGELKVSLKDMIEKFLPWEGAPPVQTSAVSSVSSDDDIPF